MVAGNHGSCCHIGLDSCFDEYNDHDPPASTSHMYVKVI